MHEGLKQAAVTNGVKMRVESKVSSIDAGAGMVHFEDGTTATGDLIIGGDGLHVSCLPSRHVPTTVVDAIESPLFGSQ